MIEVDQYKLFSLLFDYYNNELFGNHLEKRLIKTSKKDFLSFYSLNNDADEQNPAKQTLDCDNIDVHISVLHELIHVYLIKQGKPVCIGYHPKRFAKAARKIGLSTYSIIDKSKESGKDVWHGFIPADLAANAYTKFPKNVYKYNPLPVFDTSDEGKRNKLTKYQCPACKSSIWGKQDLIDIC